MIHSSTIKSGSESGSIQPGTPAEPRKGAPYTPSMASTVSASNGMKA